LNSRRVLTSISIIVVGSLLSITGFPGYSPYTPTKYALKGLVDGLDIEYRPFNIFFQLAIPADVDTPMYAEVRILIIISKYQR
jgi:3-dehydrosphinganine reductase